MDDVNEIKFYSIYLSIDKLIRLSDNGIQWWKLVGKSNQQLGASTSEFSP